MTSLVWLGLFAGAAWFPVYLICQWYWGGEKDRAPYADQVHRLQREAEQKMKLEARDGAG